MIINKEEWWATPIWFFDIPFSTVEPNLSTNDRISIAFNIM